MANDEVQYTVIGEDGTQYGPMALEDLKTLVRDSRVGPLTQVLDTTTNQWHQAEQIEELSEFFPPAGTESPATPPELPSETLPRTSTLALVSMWCGIVSVPTFCCVGWVLALLAVILGFIARHEARQYNYEGVHYATVGIACGLINLTLTGLIAAMFGPKFIDVLKNVFHQFS
jgi:hypothetical protein